MANIEDKKEALPKNHLIPSSKTRSITIPSQIESEVNFLLLPFFALSKQEARSKVSTEFKAYRKTPDGKIETFEWQVTANAKYGYPGQFDRRVFRAIESIISEMPKPIENPIPFTLYDLCRRMEINPKSGWNQRQVKEALMRIKYAGIRTQGAFFQKDIGSYVYEEEQFNIYRKIKYKGQKLSDGSIAEKNYIYLEDFYLNSINAHYIRPLDYQYIQSLKSPIAERLYELLGIKFYGVRTKNKPVIRYLYSTLCDLLPIKQQRYFSNAKKCMQTAFDELLKTKFFGKEPVWERVDHKDDWYIYFFPGKRVDEENKKPLSQGQLDLNWENENHAELVPQTELWMPDSENALPREEPESKQTVAPEAIQDKAKEAVMYFYRTFYDMEDIQHEPSRSELDLAEKYIKTYSDEILKEIIDEAIEHAHKTHWDIRNFCAIKVQVTKTLAERSKKKLHQTQIDKEALKREYDIFADNEYTNFYESLSESDLSQITEEEKTNVLNAYGKSNKKDLERISTLRLEVANFVKRRIWAMAKIPSFDEWSKHKAFIK